MRIPDPGSRIPTGIRCLGSGIAVLLLSATAHAQCDRDDDPVRLPGDADRAYRIGAWDRAEKIMREIEATDKNRHGLVHVLHRARKFDECMRECEMLAGSKDLSMRAFALALKGACAWKKGDDGGAKTWCAQAVEVADAKGPGAFPPARRLVRATLAFAAWKRIESKRFVVRAADERTLEGAAARLDEAFERVAEAIGHAPEWKIDVFLFADQREADEILAAPLSFAAPREGAMYAVPGAPLGHLVAHVLAFLAAGAKGKERPRAPFLGEGFGCAWSLDALWERRMAEVPRALQRKDKLPPLAELLTRDETGVDFVAPAGAFVRWLRADGGGEKFRRLWAEYNDHADPWTAVYGRRVEEIDAAWRATLQ